MKKWPEEKMIDPEKGFFTIQIKSHWWFPHLKKWIDSIDLQKTIEESNKDKNYDGFSNTYDAKTLEDMQHVVNNIPEEIPKEDIDITEFYRENNKTFYVDWEFKNG